MTDAVDKVGDEQPPDPYRKSLLLTRPSKNVFSTASTQSGRFRLERIEKGARVAPLCAFNRRRPPT
jgi:hypothetical protein